MNRFTLILTSLVVASVSSLALTSSSMAGFPQTATQAIPGPGKGSVTSSDLPKTARASIFDVKASEGDELDEFATAVLGSYPKLAKIKNRTVRRVLSCYFLAPGAALDQTIDEDEGIDIPKARDASRLLLAMCLNLALQSAQSNAAVSIATAFPPRPRATAPICKSALRNVGFNSTWDGKNFKVKITDTSRPKPKAKRPPISIACKPTSQGFSLTVKPTNKKKKLRQIVGKQVGIGLANTGTTPADVSTTISVK